MLIKPAELNWTELNRKKSSVRRSERHSSAPLDSLRDQKHIYIYVETTLHQQIRELTHFGQIIQSTL